MLEAIKTTETLIKFVIKTSLGKFSSRLKYLRIYLCNHLKFVCLPCLFVCLLTAQKSFSFMNARTRASEKKFMACMLLFYAIHFMTLNIVNTIESNTMHYSKTILHFFSPNSVELETSSVACT
jgi:heterodisulfide reductase subunit A-like polyferredoxin